MRLVPLLVLVFIRQTSPLTYVYLPYNVRQTFLLLSVSGRCFLIKLIVFLARSEVHGFWSGFWQLSLLAPEFLKKKQLSLIYFRDPRLTSASRQRISSHTPLQAPLLQTNVVVIHRQNLSYFANTSI